MFFTDRDKAIHEMLRVIVPARRCAVAVWDAIENVAPFAALVALLDRISGKAAGDANDSSVWARPVGVAVAHDGSLLICEDGNGTIWRVSYRGGP
jgi:hypothetical protein